ncbi:alpha/beta hydrolase domain-containing protein [Georgenia wangjunii]|uniref:alpha/beta hydrolase domain-containing protein n=1 Tax=Georgenia wangjunii TaxID=3117730 RepID=UPI002F267E8B
MARTRTLAALVAAAALTVPTALLGSPAVASPTELERRPSLATGETVPAPTVTEPVASTSPVGDPSHGYPFLATDVDLSAAGYVEEEFLISGEATRYAADGLTDATVTSTGHPYTTRIVVRRPVDAATSNGVVLAEWMNVSNGWDQEVDWFQTHEHLMREGYTWVGVSAQRAGVHSETGLKAWSPERYGALDLTDGGTIEDDSLSYDVFSQAVKALRDPAGTDPLGPIDPDYVIATGHSQSAGRLHTYYNSVQPLADVLDAVVLHGGGGPVRTDLDTPLFKLNSEGDLAIDLLDAAVRQPDSDTVRTWEVAGASHGDWKLITDYGPLRLRDIGTLPGGHPGLPQTCDLPSLSRVPQHQVQAAVYDHTVAWVAHGVQPPTADPIELDDEGQVVRDALGLAEGGIRLAAVEAPVRVNSGVNTGPGFCFLDGSSVPLPEAVLAELYPTVDTYAGDVAAATADAVQRGYVPMNVAVDQAWYSDLAYLVGDLAAEDRLTGPLATRLASWAELAGVAADNGQRDEAVRQLERIAAEIESSSVDAAARAALLRQAEAALAVLGATDPAYTPAITLDDDEVQAGTSVGVVLSGFMPDGTVVLTLDGTVLAEVEVDDEGAATADVTIPVTTAGGQFALTATQGALTVSAPLTVTAAPTPTPTPTDTMSPTPTGTDSPAPTPAPTTTPPGGGGLPSTGAEVGAALLAALVLLGTGGVLLARRRAGA